MTRKRRRLYMLVLALLGLGTATALVLTAFQDNLVFFYSPTDLLSRPTGERSLRLGGLVEQGSVRKLPDGVTTAFAVTDMANTVKVVYKGLLPDLFREGQGVVAEGRLGGDGVFVAREVLAKHDENYMPPEVADALKRAGHPQHVTATLRSKP
ncbi:MAG: cytochrome c maturation protein CcmE [Azospirillum sp.]|nr:cytochrome c maturation protein CcmE [Azospirillum sp.]